jgi:hypothetical protein
MKKLILFSFILFISFECFSQNQNEKQDTTKYTYCQIVGTSRCMSNKVTIEIDFGQFRSIWADNRLKDPKTGDRIIFNSMIDALNYMGNQGWEFVQAYAFWMGGSSGNVYHYLLKKSKVSIAKEEKELTTH